jgi:hypothetical protein
MPYKVLSEGNFEVRSRSLPDDQPRPSRGSPYLETSAERVSQILTLSDSSLFNGAFNHLYCPRAKADRLVGRLDSELEEEPKPRVPHPDEL